MRRTLRVLGCLLLALAHGPVAAQVSADLLLNRARDYFGCYEIRLVEWSSDEGRAAARTFVLSPAGIDAVIGLRGTPDAWRVTGRAMAWAALAYQPLTTFLQ
jgi:hypothetical protein